MSTTPWPARNSAPLWLADASATRARAIRPRRRELPWFDAENRDAAADDHRRGAWVSSLSWLLKRCWREWRSPGHRDTAVTCRRWRAGRRTCKQQRQRNLAVVGSGTKLEQAVLVGNVARGREKERPLGLTVEQLDAVQSDVVDDHAEGQIIGLEVHDSIQPVPLDRKGERDGGARGDGQFGRPRKIESAARLRPSAGAATGRAGPDAPGLAAWVRGRFCRDRPRVSVTSAPPMMALARILVVWALASVGAGAAGWAASTPRAVRWPAWMTMGEET